MAKDFQELFKDITAEYVSVYDVNNKKFLYDREGSCECYPASITKLLNAAVAIHYLKEDDLLTVGDELDICYSSPDPSVAGIKKGQVWKFSDILYGLFLPSGNDCAYTIGYNIVNRMDKYKDLTVKEKCLKYRNMMNRYAKKLGCKSTSFYTLCGNDHVNGKVVRHVTCTNDLCLILEDCMKSDLLVKVMSTAKKEILYKDDKEEKLYSFTNTNRLIRKDSEFYNPYVIGGKTGTTNLAGYCLASFAKKDDKCYIVALTYAASSPDRFRDSNKIYDFLFKE